MKKPVSSREKFDIELFGLATQYLYSRAPRGHHSSKGELSKRAELYCTVTPSCTDRTDANWKAKEHCRRELVKRLVSSATFPALRS